MQTYFLGASLPQLANYGKNYFAACYKELNMCCNIRIFTKKITRELQNKTQPHE